MKRIKQLYKPKWYVYHYDFNRRKIETYPLLDGRDYGFDQTVKENLKKNNSDKEKFKERLKSDLMYRFWSRCEYEILISGFPPTDDKREEKKVDIYDQVCLNFDVFADYIWNSVTHPALESEVK